ncbi:MAG: GNAT family N-acetyltransferase [Pseudomonadota bacterium]
MRAVAGRAFAPVYSGVRARVGEPLASLAYGSAERDQIERLNELCASDATRDMLVVECAHRVVGFGHVLLDHDRKIGEIGLNAIDPPHQGKGYGRKLHAAMLDRMRAAGMFVATVTSGHDDAHATALRAYMRAGFTGAVPQVSLYRPL